MTAATSRLRRRGIGAGVAALVGLSGLGFAAMPAQAAAGFNPAATQVSGVDRFDTAAQIATKAFTTATTVVVANGDRAIDAQAGAYVAGLNNAPILLTQKSNVPAYTVDAIKKLGATKAIVLGDSNSVDATALAQMTAAGLTVTVVAGADRFETAADIYNLGTTKSSTVFLARADLLAGQVSPDALAASPLSYDGTPVLLTNAASLPQATADAIKNGGVKNVVVLGNAITDSVKTAVTALGATVTTIAGDDRSLTAQKIADYGIAQGKYMKTTATIANGDKIDALAAGPWAAKNNAPILLTLGTNSLGTGTTNYLTANASTLTTGVAFGDTNSVPASLTAAAVTAAQGGTAASNQAYSLTPTGAVTRTVSVGTDNNGVVQYTVSGLGTTPVDIQLFESGNVTIGANGAVTFAGTGTATVGTPVGAIAVVNGVTNTGQSALNVTPVNGSVTFTLNSTAVGSAVPVVFAHESANTTLSIGSTGAPSEAFGVGGPVTWTAPAAATGTYSGSSVTTANTMSALTVTAVNSAAQTFQATYTMGNGTAAVPASGTFAYGASGTTYSSGSIPLSSQQFSTYLGAGDVVSANYNSTGPSSFSLVSDVPASPTNVAAAYTTTGGSGINVTWTAPVNPGTYTYTVQRASVTNGVVGSYGTLTSSATGTSYKDTTGTAGSTYSYRVVATNGSLVSPNSAATQATVPAAGFTALASAPVSISSTVSPAGTTGNVATGDVIRVTFNEPLATPAAGASLTVTDGSSVASLTNGTNANFTVGGTTNNVLTITTTGAPAFSAGASLGYPIDVTASNGVADTTGQAWNAALGNVTLPSNAAVAGLGAVTAPTAASGSAVISGTGAVPGATVTVVVAGSVSAANGTYTAIADSSGAYSVTAAANLGTGSTYSITQQLLQGGSGTGAARTGSI